MKNCQLQAISRRWPKANEVTRRMRNSVNSESFPLELRRIIVVFSWIIMVRMVVNSYLVLKLQIVLIEISQSL